MAMRQSAHVVINTTRLKVSISSMFKFAIEGSMFSYSVVALPHVGQHVIIESYINVKVLTITLQLLLND